MHWEVREDMVAPTIREDHQPIVALLDSSQRVNSTCWRVCRRCAAALPACRTDKMRRFLERLDILRTAGLLIGLLILVLVHGEAAERDFRIVRDPARQALTIASGDRSLVLHLRYDGHCVLDQVRVDGREVAAADSGAWTGFKRGGQWHTAHGIPTPSVSITKETATINGIVCTDGEFPLHETWSFDAAEDRIVWRIEREYVTDGRVEDMAFAGWDFTSMSTWTGALLDNGGVAWCKLFRQPNSSYGVHSGAVTLWHRDQSACLRISPRSPAGGHIATRFSRQPDGVFRITHTLSENRLTPGQGQARFRRDQQDIWAPWSVRSGSMALEITLQVMNDDRAYDRGRFPHFNGASIREILNTIARIGAIDDEVMGSNGYYSGFAVLHEPWIAQLGLAIDDPSYFRAYARTLDHQRDHAIDATGRVKPRWSYGPGDAMPGTYDESGYYECQWGLLMDSQPSYPINVAEQFDYTGDLDWLERHKASVEKALGYLLHRDTDNDGLVEMATTSHLQAQGSDWLDVIWAAHENALVNAELYRALTLWTDLEEVLADDAQARLYRECAARLKAHFNASTADGGFWSEEKQCFVHWRDKDGSVHGDNLVIPVNFMAIAYDLCEPAERARTILDKVESRMEREGLFFWPICFDSYQAGEGAAWQFPFPNYENGDIFLAWGETGTRAYAGYQPAVAIKYIQNVLNQYERDGLAFQRYLRTNQTGAGGDILANNCSPVVGLYRNIYGLQPRWNRLYLEPHLTRELAGTRLNYWLRDQDYRVALNPADYRVSVDGFTLRDSTPFGLAVQRDRAAFFHRRNPRPSLVVGRPGNTPLEVQIQIWSDDPAAPRKWTVMGLRSGMILQQTHSLLVPATEYRLRREGADETRLRSDAQGQLVLRATAKNSDPVRFELDSVDVQR